MNVINILAIEDFHPDVIVIQDFLKEANFKHNFFHKVSLREGIELTQDQIIDIVLLDLSLTDASGFSTLTKFIEEVPHIPVIVMTGSTNKDLGERAVRVGAQDYIFKGIWDARAIVKSIIFSLHRWEDKKKLKAEADKLKVDVHNMGKVFHIAKIGYWKMNIVSNTMEWDEEMFHIFGYENGSFTPHFSDYLNFVHINDRDQVNLFFETVTKGIDPQEIKHKIVLGPRLIKDVLVRARLEHSELEGDVLIIGSVQDITNLEDFQAQFRRYLFGILETPLFQSLFSTLNFQFDSKQLLKIFNWLSALEESPQKAAFLDFIKDSASNNLNLITRQLITNPNTFNFKQTYFNTIEDLTGLSHAFQECYSLAIKPNADYPFPEQFEVNLDLVFHLLYTTRHLKVIDSEKPAATPLNCEVTYLRASNNLQLKFSGPLRTQYLKELLNSKIEKFGSSMPNEPIYFWKSFVLQQMVLLGSGSLHLAATDNHQLASITIQIPFKAYEIQELKEEGNIKQSNLNLLVVDDRFLNRMNIKTKLEEIQSVQMVIEEAENGKDALKKMEQQTFDLVLLDAHMPIMNGIEAAGRMKKNNKDLPIILMYNQLNEEELHNCKHIEIDAYLPKPIKDQKLKEVLESIIEN